MPKRLAKHFKFVWVALIITWVIAMLGIMLYLELFMGINGILTHVTTEYNIKSQKYRVGSAIKQWSQYNDKSVLPEQIKNVESFKNIVGIGCIKCGSTYFHSLLLRNTRFWERNNLNSTYHFVFKWEETHYFEQCTNCTFNGYLNTLSRSQATDPLQYRPTNKIWIMGEKTATYFDHYHAANLLAFYGHKYDVFFYIVLRNPVKQLWSHLWMRTEGCSHHLTMQCLLIRNENYYLQRDNVQDIMLMARYLNNFLLFQIQNELPIFDELMNGLKIDKNINNENNDDIDEIKIIELLMKRTSDILHYYSHVFVQSCHYALILLWYHEWNAINALNGHKSIEFADRFRIIQIENVFDSESVSDQYIKRLMCWMIGYEMDLNECYKKGMITRNERKKHLNKFIGNKVNKELRKYAPDIMDVLDLNVSNTIKAFYNDSLQRLIWFIDKHPRIMIGNTQFTPYW